MISNNFKLLENYHGMKFNLADNWFSFINVNYYKDIPINYLEIGAYHGANIVSVANSYGLHPNSKLYGIDPWEDYNDYPEYKDKQHKNYETFINNIELSGKKNKIIINRGYSHNEIPKFQDNFSILYI